MSINVPATIWQPTQGNSEFSGTDADYIVDIAGLYLVDPSGVFIVDTGVIETPIPATIWTEDDSL